ncbi:alpha/beta fold hydrolase [Segetibacter koreensis]|uniref:alpha/beta fold hydrolase n=1 Tax=Segetibacter koreensis TaxID=398037 RepID=UPI0003A6F807|nr:alpha/beta hydrolase [Segetibacter koreensis]
MIISLVKSIFGAASTEKIDKQKFPNSIAELRAISVGNFEQYILIRGKDIANPIILFIHGGPGIAEMHEVRALSNSLEANFTLVTWDQRGCGKSYSKQVPNFTHKQITADGAALIQYLKHHFNKDKIYLVTHSWGTVLGLDLAQLIPADIKAIISIAQLVDFARAELMSYNFALEQATKNNDVRSVKVLKRIGPPHDGLYANGAKGLTTERKILMQQGGVYYNKNKFIHVAMLLLLAPEYTLREKLLYNKGINQSLTAIWNSDLTKTNFIKQLPEISVPIYLFHGRTDYIAPLSIVEEYFNLLKAPQKKLVIFEGSGHDPRIDEPEKFVKELYECFK